MKHAACLNPFKPCTWLKPLKQAQSNFGVRGFGAGLGFRVRYSAFRAEGSGLPQTLECRSLPFMVRLGSPEIDPWRNRSHGAGVVVFGDYNFGLEAYITTPQTLNPKLNPKT